MPSPTTYIYSISADCPNGLVNIYKLKLAIQASAIVISLSNISTSNNILAISFNDILSGTDQNILDGGSGSPYGTHPAGGLIANTDNSPTFSPGEAGVAALGALRGQAPSSYGQSFGYITTSSTSSAAIRATIYTSQTNAVQRSISSSSASDTSAGTGARQVRITYYDNTLAGPSTEIITLNGTTAVNTSQTNIAFIEKLEVVSAGSNGGNVGTITLYIGTGGGGDGFASIASGDNITYWAHHYVPSNQICYITQIFGSASAVLGGISINTANPISGNTTPQLSPDITMRYGTSEGNRSYPTPLGLAGPILIWLNTRPDTSSASTTYAGFHWSQV